MTSAVDWALKANYLSTYYSVCVCCAGGRTTPHCKLPPEQHPPPMAIEEHPSPLLMKVGPGVLSSPAEEEERVSLLDR